MSSNGRQIGKKIAYQLKGTVPISEIPSNDFQSPYEKLLRAITKAGPGEAVRAQTASVEEAHLLWQRLYKGFNGKLLVKHPKGSKIVYVAAKPGRRVAAKSRAKTTPKKTTRSKRQ